MNFALKMQGRTPAPTATWARCSLATDTTSQKRTSGVVRDLLFLKNINQYMFHCLTTVFATVFATELGPNAMNSRKLGLAVADKDAVG